MSDIINNNLEMSVLGCIMRFPDETFHEIRQTIGDRIECFENETFREIYKVLCAIDDKGEKLDYRNIVYHIQTSNTILLDSFDVIWAKGNKDAGLRDAERLIEILNRRELTLLTSQMSAKALDPNTPLSDIVELFERFNEKKTLVKKQSITLRESVEKLKQRIEKNQTDEKPEGTPTGFGKLDETNGFHKGEFIVIAGASSHGKTSLALTMTRYAIKNGYKIAYYSLEMEHISLTARLTAMESNVSASAILFNKLLDTEKNNVKQAMERLSLDNLFYDDSATSSFETIMSSIRMMKKRYDISGAIVDYIQILNVNSRTKDTQERIMATVARKFKNLAIELGIWIIGLSQLNRDKENPQPRLDRIRDSGQIVEAADTVIFVYRAELYERKYEGKYRDVTTENTALIDIAKGRNIGIGSFIVDFTPTITLFTQHEYTDEEKKSINGDKNKKPKNYLDNLIKNIQTQNQTEPQNQPKPQPREGPPQEQTFSTPEDTAELPF